jgi:Acyl-CoA oxidase
MELSGKLSEKDKNSFDSWNETQVFFIHDLARSYAELVCMTEFSKRLTLVENSNDDSKECVYLLFKLNALHKI